MTACIVPASAIPAADLPRFVFALADVLDDESENLARLRARHAWAADPANPNSYGFIVDEHGPAGWVGWIPYGGPVDAVVDGLEPGDRVWGSSTYLAPRLHGTGFYDATKCWQAHAATEIAYAFPGSVFITLIAVFNERSVAAFRRFTGQHGWRNERLVDEAWRTRSARVFTWPAPTARHQCVRLPVAAVAA